MCKFYINFFICFLIFFVTECFLTGEMYLCETSMSRPYTFTFANDVYMAVNLDPTVYGLFTNATEYVHQARTEIGLYKIINNTPVLMRRIANPTGLHYYAMCETPPLIPDGSTAPLYKQDSIYMTFSEDRRRLYHRAFGNVSFVDITALFANNDRLG